MTRCGDANETVSAIIHGATVLLYAAMLIYHARSTVEHVQRAVRERSEA